MNNPENSSSTSKPARKKNSQDLATTPSSMRKYRPKPPSAEGVAQATAPLSRYVAYTPLIIDRTMIKNAPYNPRTIDADSRARLEQSLKEDGLVASVTWNKRTGNLVGGHQRLSVLDDLHVGKPYSLPVDAIDVDDVKERTLNIKLNSPDLAGQYDLQQMDDLLHEIKTMDETIDLSSAIGLTDMSLEALNVSPELYLEEAKPLEMAVLEDADAIAKLKNIRKQHKQKKREEDVRVARANLIVKFPDSMDLDKIEVLRAKFFARLGMRPDTDDPLIPYWRFAAALGLEGATNPEEDEDL